MSPEQVRGASSVDHRADLYSLGMCLFHALTGDYAYYSASYSDILVGICTQPLPLLREKAPWVPEAVELWFQRACAREPLERFQSADEMTEALQAAAGASSPLSKHKSVPEGRIAPETLVGFAAPALTTLQLDPAQLGLARTQAQAQSQPAARAPQPTPIVVASGSRDSALTGSAWLLPAKSLRPLLIGLGLAVLALASLAATLLLMGRRAPSEPLTRAETSASQRRAGAAPSPSPSVEPSAPTQAPSTLSQLSQPRQGRGAAVSSVAAPAPARRKPALPSGTAKKSTPAAAPPAPAPPAPRSPGSDLGF
jgi:serine/threonine-protein kinase